MQVDNIRFRILFSREIQALHRARRVGERKLIELLSRFVFLAIFWLFLALGKLADFAAVNRLRHLAFDIADISGAVINNFANKLLYVLRNYKMTAVGFVDVIP